MRCGTVAVGGMRADWTWEDRRVCGQGMGNAALGGHLHHGPRLVHAVVLQTQLLGAVCCLARSTLGARRHDVLLREVLALYLLRSFRKSLHSTCCGDLGGLCTLPPAGTSEQKASGCTSGGHGRQEGQEGQEGQRCLAESRCEPG